jgi:hypothetical protein
MGLQMVTNGYKWLQMVTNGYKWLQIIEITIYTWTGLCSY